MISTNPSAKDCITMLEKLVAFDTTSRNSNLELIEFVRNELEQIGVDTRLTFNEEKTKANLWATIGPQKRGGVVLSGHTDVVPVDGQDWASDPFKLVERDGRLFGRGSADMKGFVACVVAHAARMNKANLITPLHFAFSYDEEVGCTGVLGLIDDMRENLPAPLAVIVGEPTLMQIVGGNKGSEGFITTIHGVDGHSSLPGLGANAIMAAGRIIAYLHDMQKRLKASADPSNGFNPPYTTIDCGVINGGVAANIIPSKCTFQWGFRCVPEDDVNELVKEVKDFIAAEIEPGLKAVSQQAGIVHVPRHSVPGLAPNSDSPAEMLLRHLTGLNTSGRVSYGTEAGQFQTAGVPGVIFGPGSIEQAHLPDEYVAVSEMEACHEFLLKLTDWAAKSDGIS